VTGGLLGPVVEHLSESFLGDEEILLETFEFLHTAFFEIGIGFFVVAGLTVADALYEINKLSTISELALDKDKDGEVTLGELADAICVDALVVDTNGDGILSEEECTEALRECQPPSVWKQLLASTDRTKIGAEALVIRQQMINACQLPNSFQIEKYIERTFGHDLDEIVELNPLTWLPLIPIFALANSIDLSNDVVSAASSNAFVTAGEFITNPWVVASRFAVQALTLVWSLFNYWKMAQIKNMLVATLVRDGMDGPAVLLKPRYQDELLRSQFNSSPGWVRPIEQFFTGGGTPARNPHEELFGAAGADGPALYRNSIKFHTWLCVAQIVFMGSQVVARDINALLQHSTVMAHPEAVLPEAIFFGFFVVVSMAQLALAPQTFLCYSQATSIELMTKEWALKSAIQETKIEAWKEADETSLELDGFSSAAVKAEPTNGSTKTSGAKSEDMAKYID